MREIQMQPPLKRKPYEIVRRLEFFAGGTELVGWIGDAEFTPDGWVGFTSALHVCDLLSNSVRRLIGMDGLERDFHYRTPNPLLTPDRQLLAFEDRLDADTGFVYFSQIVPPDMEPARLPSLPIPSDMGALIFTPDGKELFAVQNPDYGEAESEVVRLKMASLFKPPVRVEEQTNPLTGRTYQTPIHAVRWNPVMTLPGTERIATAAISSDGRLLAVGGAEGVVHVADLKRKKTLASFPWEGRKPRDRAAVRVAFDPTAEWVAMLANGRLFARPLGAGNGWQTKAALGYAHDFAFHPEGRVLCAVFADGRARFLDPLTGAVRQTFAWAKRPKPLYSVAFAPDGLTCAAGGENGLVVVWDVDG